MRSPTLESISALSDRTAASEHSGEDSITLVAEWEGEIVGFIDARLDRSPDAMHREIIYCHVAEIAVRPRHQNKGIGARLLRAAEDWGRRHGAAFASLEDHIANSRADAFYQRRMGYRAAQITVIKRL
jgi:GNAT superfamily N-acetyltransferase